MRTLYDILLQLIRDTYAAVDRIHRLLDGLEIFLKDTIKPQLRSAQMPQRLFKRQSIPKSTPTCQLRMSSLKS